MVKLPVVPQYDWGQDNSRVWVNAYVAHPDLNDCKVRATTASLTLEHPPYVLDLDLCYDVDGTNLAVNFGRYGIRMELPKGTADEQWPWIKAKGGREEIEARRKAAEDQALQTGASELPYRLLPSPGVTRDQETRNLDLRLGRQWGESNSDEEELLRSFPGLTIVTADGTRTLLVDLDDEDDDFHDPQDGASNSSRSSTPSRNQQNAYQIWNQAKQIFPETSSDDEDDATYEDPYSPSPAAPHQSAASSASTPPQSPRSAALVTADRIASGPPASSRSTALVNFGQPRTRGREVFLGYTAETFPLDPFAPLMPSEAAGRAAGSNGQPRAACVAGGDTQARLAAFWAELGDLEEAQTGQQNEDREPLVPSRFAPQQPQAAPVMPKSEHMAEAANVRQNEGSAGFPPQKLPQAQIAAAVVRKGEDIEEATTPQRSEAGAEAAPRNTTRFYAAQIVAKLKELTEASAGQQNEARAGAEVKEDPMSDGADNGLAEAKIGAAPDIRAAGVEPVAAGQTQEVGPERKDRDHKVENGSAERKGKAKADARGKSGSAGRKTDPGLEPVAAGERQEATVVGGGNGRKVDSGKEKGKGKGKGEAGRVGAEGVDTSGETSPKGKRKSKSKAATEEKGRGKAEAGPSGERLELGASRGRQHAGTMTGQAAEGRATGRSIDAGQLHDARKGIYMASEALKLMPDNLGALFSRAQAYKFMNSFRDAFDDCTHALRVLDMTPAADLQARLPGHIPVSHHKVRFLGLRAEIQALDGDVLRAVADCDEGLRLIPGHEPTQHLRDNLMMVIATHLPLMRRPQEATGPSSAELMLRARHFECKEDWSQALQCYGAVIQQEGDGHGEITDLYLEALAHRCELRFRMGKAEAAVFDCMALLDGLRPGTAKNEQLLDVAIKQFAAKLEDAGYRTNQGNRVRLFINALQTRARALTVLEVNKGQASRDAHRATFLIQALGSDN